MVRQLDKTEYTPTAARQLSLCPESDVEMTVVLKNIRHQYIDEVQYSEASVVIGLGKLETKESGLIVSEVCFSRVNYNYLLEVISIDFYQ